MASLSKQSSSGKPKLERRNARKIADYEPSDSPRPASVPSSFRKLDKDSSKSFRVTGFDSEGELEKIYKQLGIDGGADAFSIPQDAWEKGKAKSGSLDRFIREHKHRSRSLDEPPATLFDQHGRGSGNGELAVSPVASTSSLSPSPFYNSSASSGDSFASDSSLVAGEKGFFGSLDTPRQSGLVLSETRHRDDHQQPGSAIQHARDYGMHETQHLDNHKQTGNVARERSICETWHRDDCQQPGSVIQHVRNYGIHETQHFDDRKQTGMVAHEPPIGETRHHNNYQTRTGTVPYGRDQASHDTQHVVNRKGTDSVTQASVHEMRHHDNRQTGNEMERVPKVVTQSTRPTIETNRQSLIPPPAFRAKPYLPALSTQELIASFGPDEVDFEKQVSDYDDTASSGPEDCEDEVIADKAREEVGFVSEVVLQHSVSAKEQTHVEDAGSAAPSTPEHSPNLIRIQSWRKLEMLGSGSFGTVYEGMSEDGVYFAVKEVSLSENDSKAQQCVTQLEQEIEFLSKFQHENIVQYLGTQKEADKLYIFLELVTKGSLSSLYQKYNLFDSQIRSYTRQILNGLKYLHERKVMHRDIKCANILVDVTGKIKVADFGLAKQISQLDELKSCKGSAYWMAPEVIDPKKTYSFPADIWSLGCTVLEMETRRPPFGDMEWHRALWKVGHGEAPPIPDNLSDDAKDFIKHCLVVNPAKRPSARKLLEHPFVQYAGTGLTPRNSFTEETSELPVIAEDKTLD